MHLTAFFLHLWLDAKVHFVVSELVLCNHKLILNTKFCLDVPVENPGKMAGAEGKESGVNRKGKVYTKI